MHLQEQEAAQSRAKRELEAEMERCRQVGEDGSCSLKGFVQIG